MLGEKFGEYTRLPDRDALCAIYAAMARELYHAAEVLSREQEAGVAGARKRRRHRPARRDPREWLWDNMPVVLVSLSLRLLPPER